MSPNAQENKEEHRLDFFRHDQIVFLVTHEKVADEGLPDDQLPDKILMDWIAPLKEQLNKREWRLTTDLPLRSYSFPEVGEDESREVPDNYREERFNGAFSIIVCNVESNSIPRDQIKTNKDRVKAKMGLLDLITMLDENRNELTTAFPVLTVQGVFPNWIASSSSSDSGGTGGPGGRPAPYTGSSEQIPFYFDELISQLQARNSLGKALYGKGEDVDVIILDTAPSAHDLVLAHKELVLLKEAGKKHRLLEHLLGPSGRLKLYPATYEEQLRMGNTSLNKHGYKMVDHGLFVAGIIHSIVPNATIHLIEVLNQFGVGDLETIARGLSKAYAICRQNKREAVINESLCLEIPNQLEEYAYRPIKEEELILQPEKDLEKELRNRLNSLMMQLKLKFGDKKATDELPWVLAIRVMCERLGKVGRQVVAAAGNQGEDAGQSRNAPDASYPAAFGKVVGVGALPKNAKRPDDSGKYNASSFSNLADKPAQTGIMALGGEQGAGNGVLGVYLGEFPPDSSETGQTIGSESAKTKKEHGWAKTGEPCENGWAWWAGTSFATPILVGAIAAVLSGSTSPGTTQRALDLLYTAYIIENALTEKNEDGMPSSLTQTVPPANWP